MGGEISYSLVNLQNLRYLDLSCNSFNGAQIQEFLGSMLGLRYLNLSYTLLHGKIPPQIGNLTKLTFLDLKCWAFSNPRYNHSFSVNLAWLSQLSSLKHLDMSYVNLHTAVDWIHEINMLPTLKELHLQNSGLKYTVPSLHQFNLTILEVLDISENFNTTITPNWFWNATSLTFLNIKECYFYGPIPDEIGKMTSLEHVSFQQNNLMSTMIPSSFKNLCNLKVLDLANSNTTGDITELIERLPNCHWNTPPWIWSLRKLVLLDLSENQIDGIVNEYHLNSLKDLEYLGLGVTLLQIKIRPNWVPPFKLKGVVLDSIKLGPTFPSWLKSQTSIKFLAISNASINAIPDWFWVVFSGAEFLDTIKYLAHYQKHWNLCQQKSWYCQVID